MHLAAETPYLYRRQFIAGSRTLPRPQSWKEIRFGAATHIVYHPLVAVTQISSDSKQIVCLGHVLDPDDPASTNDEILRRIVSSMSSFHEFERSTSKLGGRYLMFVKLGCEERLYPDAGGTKSAFYVRQEETREQWIASQPQLLVDMLGVSLNSCLAKDFFRSHVHNSWPGELTPFNGVRQLLPNHFLEVRTGRVERFWPRTPIKHQDIETAVVVARQMLSGLIASALRRRRVAMTVTGGYDSRAILACAGAFRREVSLFTVGGPDVTFGDVAIPRKLARRLGSELAVIPADPHDRSFWATYQRNVAGMLWDTGSRLIYTFRRYGDDDWFILTGNVGEAARCFYYKNGLHPTEATPERLAKICGYGGSPVASESFRRWLSDVPEDTGVNLLDLLYWEHRMGNWLAMALTGSDTVCEILPMYNCRYLLETALGVDVELRKAPYRLFVKICHEAAPVLIGVPFNDTLRDRVTKLATGYMPWRLRHQIHSLRLKIAGFSICDGQPPSVQPWS